MLDLACHTCPPQGGPPQDSPPPGRNGGDNPGSTNWAQPQLDSAPANTAQVCPAAGTEHHLLFLFVL